MWREAVGLCLLGWDSARCPPTWTATHEPGTLPSLGSSRHFHHAVHLIRWTLHPQEEMNHILSISLYLFFSGDYKGSLAYGQRSAPFIVWASFWQQNLSQRQIPVPTAQVARSSVRHDTWMSSGDFTAPSGLALRASGAGIAADPLARHCLSWGWHKCLGPSHHLDDSEKCFWFLGLCEGQSEGMPLGSAQHPVTGEISSRGPASTHTAATSTTPATKSFLLTRAGLQKQSKTKQNTSQQGSEHGEYFQTSETCELPSF